MGGDWAVCTKCLDNRSAAGGATACVCTAPGFGLVNGDCVQCPIGYYAELNTATGSNDCVTCGTGYTTLGVGTISSSSCACDAGYGLNTTSGACEACPFPFYQVCIGVCVS